MTLLLNTLCATALDAIVSTTPIEEVAGSSTAPFLAGSLIVMAVAFTVVLILRLFRKK